MRRLAKMLLAVLLLVVGAAAAFLLTFDVNRYKPQLVEFVAHWSGRDFAVSGDIHFAPSLLPTLVAEGVRLGNAAWGRGGDLADIERVEAQLALKPLLERRIEVKHVVLDGANVNLETDAQGTGNWVLRAQQPATGKDARAHTSLPEFAIERITLANSTLKYVSGATGQSHSLVVDKFTATAPHSDAPVAVQFTGTYMVHPVEMHGRVGSWKALANNQSWPVDLAASIREARFTARGTIERPLAGEGMSLAVTAQAGSLASLGELATVELPPLAPVSVMTTLVTSARRYRLQDLKATIGGSTLTGELAFSPSAPRPAIEGRIEAKRVDLTEFPPPPREQSRTFSTAPMFLNTLPPLDAHLALHAEEVKTHRWHLTDVRAEVSQSPQQLQVKKLHARVAGGTVEGVIAIVPGFKSPRVDLDLHGKGLLPAQMPQLRDKHLSGAPVDFVVDINGGGQSIADVMGSGNGRLMVRMGPGRMPNNLASADLLLDTVRMLNPLSTRDSHTAIDCAVFNFGVKNGIASTQDGIAVRTEKLSVLGGGIVNLKSESIDIGVKAKPRAGTGLNLASLGGDLVRIGGTLSHPKPVPNARAVAGAGLRVGAAVATGGLSLLAEGLFDRATGDADVCAIALHGASRSTATAATPASAPPQQERKSVLDKTTEKTRKAVKSTGEAVRSAVRKLFGR